MYIRPSMIVVGTNPQTIDLAISIIKAKYPGLSESSLKKIRTELDDGGMVFELDILRMERADLWDSCPIIGWSNET